MGEKSNIEDILKEWRDLIVLKLEKLAESQEDIKADISKMQTAIAVAATDTTSIKEQEKRIRELENFKERALTLFFVIQFLVGTGLVILNHLWK